MAKKKYPTRTSILGKLITMVFAKYGSAKGLAEDPKMLVRLDGLAITPDLPDETIEEALQRLVDSGDFVPKQD
jgi:hypothetical protein